MHAYILTFVHMHMHTHKHIHAYMRTYVRTELYKRYTLSNADNIIMLYYEDDTVINQQELQRMHLHMTNDWT